MAADERVHGAALRKGTRQLTLNATRTGPMAFALSSTDDACVLPRGRGGRILGLDSYGLSAACL
jgi:hypothetical protein